MTPSEKQANKMSSETKKNPGGNAYFSALNF